MPRANSVFGIVDTVGTNQVLLPDALPVDAGSTPVAIRFLDGTKVHLPAGAPSFHRWALDVLRSLSRPVYVTISDRQIDRVEIPVVGHVTLFERGADGSAVVGLDATSRALYLPSEDDRGIETVISDAAEKGTVVWIAADEDGRIIDVGHPAPPLDVLAPVYRPGAALPLESILVSRVPTDELQRVFEIATQTRCGVPPAGDCVPFNYPDQGCEARAHRMCELLAVDGFVAGKVWMFGKMLVRTPNRRSCSVGWTWHVAPYVRDARGEGLASVQVIDPAVEETGSIDLPAYLTRIDAKPARVLFAASTYYRVDGNGGGAEERRQFTRSGSQCADDLIAYRGLAARRRPQPPYPPCLAS